MEIKDINNDNNYSFLSNISTCCSSSYTDLNDEKIKYWLKYNLYDVKVDKQTFNYPILFPLKEVIRKNSLIIQRKKNIATYIKMI